MTRRAATTLLFVTGVALATSCGQTSADAPRHPDASADLGTDAPADVTNSGADAAPDSSDTDASDSAEVADVAECWLPEPSQPLTDAEKACATLATAACERMDSCMPGGWNFELALAFPHADVEICQSRLAVRCADRVALAGSPAPADLVACAANVSTWTCDDVFKATRFGDKPNSTPITPEIALHLCGTNGTRLDGEACDSGMQCASGNCYRKDLSSDCGVCAPYKQVGESCESGCEFGLYCYSTLECGDAGCSWTAGTCAPYGGAGADCVDPESNPQWSYGCQRGLYCYQNKCLTSAAPGESCAEGNGGSPFCNGFDGCYCEPPGSVCECAPPGPQPNLCFSPDDVHCYDPSKGEGEGCFCLFPAVVVAGNCTLPKVLCTK